MKVTLYNDVSLDGFIAKPDDSTDWICGIIEEFFLKLVKEKKVVIMGRVSCETAEDEFPYDCELNVVMTRNRKYADSHNTSDDVWFTTDSPKRILAELKRLGYRECLLLGGGLTNSSFLEEKLIDEIIVSVHPVILGKGIKIFEDAEFDVELERIAVEELDEGVMQIVYAVKK